MQTALLRFGSARLALKGRQSLWIMASSAVATVAGCMLTVSHSIWAEARPEVQIALAMAVFSASAALAWFTPPLRVPPPSGLLPKQDLAGAMVQHFARGNAPATLVLFELTGLSWVSRGVDRQAGEDALAQARQHLLALLPGAALAARWSEERFLAFLPGPEDALAIINLARAMTSLPRFAGAASAISIHAGIVQAPTQGESIETLVERAELALGEARQQGKPGYGFYAPRLSSDAERRQALQRAVREAVTGDALRLEFQPVYAMRSGELSGFEALIRLHDPQLGPIRPSEFIPVAEQEGSILDIGQWTLDEACRVAAQWPAHLVVAVNLSPAELLSGTAITSVRRALQRHALPAYRLEVEITEGTLMSDSELVLGQLRMLRDMGVGVALDDFGTGYSSLSYLCKFPFSKLKIDRSFAAALDQTASAKNVLRAIVRLGHGLGMTVTAEGIENERQLTMLRGIGCDLGQGYLLGRPAPLSELAAIIIGNFAQTLSRRPRSAGRSAA